MSTLKKLAGVKRSQRMHDTEDARVNVQTEPKKPGNRSLVSRLKGVAKSAAKFFLYRSVIWLWDHSASILDWIYSNVENIL